MTPSDLIHTLELLTQNAIESDISSEKKRLFNLASDVIKNDDVILNSITQNQHDTELLRKLSYNKMDYAGYEISFIIMASHIKNNVQDFSTV